MIRYHYRMAEMILMTPRDWLNEILYPLVTPAVLIPLLVSWLLFTMSLGFGLYGLFLFMVTLIPFTRYLMTLLRARAHNRAAPVFDAELMSLAGSSYQLFPLVTLAVLGGSVVWLRARVDEPFVVAFGAIACGIFPATLALLSLTRSPLRSWNPLALMRLIRETGIDYAVCVALLFAVGFSIYLMLQSGVSWVFVLAGEMYFAFFLYSVSGAITGNNNLAEEIDIPEPLQESTEAIDERVLKERENVATHAYGFASRGNRDGAFKHIEQHIARDAYPGDAWPWFYRKMLTWDNQDHALFFAQIYLRKLLAAGEDALALKLISECLYVNPLFRPAAGERDAVSALVQKHQRTDLAEQLR